MNKLRACGALSLLALSLPLRAADYTPEDYAAIAKAPFISEMLSYQIKDSARQSKNGVGGVLSGSVPLSDWFNIELGGSYTHFNGDGTTPSYVWRDYVYKADGLFFLKRGEWSPYLDIGAGDSRIRNRTLSASDAAFLADAGAGVIKYFHVLGAPLGVRFDARYRWTFVNENKFAGINTGSFGEPIISLGLVIPLGVTETAAAEPPVPVAPVKPAPAPVVSENPNRKFEDIHFAFDKSDLTDYSKALLDQDATTFNKMAAGSAGLKLDVSGHTDWIGTDAYNQALSERRANAAKDYLARKGVDATRIRTFAYGESQPIAPNTTAEGRALNRRDEIKTTTAP